MKLKAKIVPILLLGLIITLVGCSTENLHGDKMNNKNHTATHTSGDGEHIADSQSSTTSEGHFPTIGLEERVETTIPFPVAQVCPLYEPAGRFLMYEWWDPIILQEAEGDTLEGLIMSSYDFSVETLLKVTKHAPEEGHIQYIVLWGDFELQRIDITCLEGDTSDSTTVIWNEQNSGMYENGASAVKTYVTAGALRDNVEKYAQNATRYLQDQ